MKLLTSFLILVSLSACSKKSSVRTLEITRASIAGDEFQGGVIVKITNLTTSLTTVKEFSAPPFQVLIEDGKWSFDLVGFMGPSPWGGTQMCGSNSVTLTSSDLNIDLRMNSACALIVYQDLIAPKTTKWDNSVWNTAKWAP